MYRIKLPTGEESVFSSMEEFAVGVKNGIVTPDALIYHARAERWLEVRMHPHYQLATGSRTAGSGGQTQARPAAAPAAPSAAPGLAPRPAVVPTGGPASSQPSDIRASAPRPAVDVSSSAPRPAAQPHAAVPSRTDITPTRAQMLELVEELGKSPEPKPFKPQARKQNTLEFLDVEDKPRAQGTKVFELPKVREASPPRPAAPRMSSPASAPAATPLTMEHKPAPSAPAAPAASAAAATTAAPSAKPSQPSGSLKAIVIEKVAPAPSIPESDLEFPPPSTILPALRESTRAEAKIDAISALAPAAQPFADVVVGDPTVEMRRKNPLLPVLGLAAMLVIGVGILIWRPWVSGLSATTDAAKLTAGQPGANALHGAAPSSAAPTAVAAITPSTPAATPSGRSAPAASPQAAVPTARDSAKPDPIIPSAVKVDLRVSRVDLGVSAEISRTTGSGPVISPSVLARHYAAAYSEAGDELNGKMDDIGFTKLFLPEHLSSSSGLASTRRTLAAASSAIHGYRTRSNSIEQAYQDTLMQSERRQKSSPEEFRAWAARASQRESQDAVQFTDLMVNQVDSLLSLLAAQQGHYSLNGEKITFSDAQAGRQYEAVRAWISQRADAWAGTPESAMPASVKYLLRAIGTPKLPK